MQRDSDVWRAKTDRHTWRGVCSGGLWERGEVAGWGWRERHRAPGGLESLEALDRRVWALMGGRGQGQSRCACVRLVPSLGCWPGVPGAGDRCPASPHPPPEWGQLAQPPSASVRFQAVPWGNFDLERMRVTDLAAAQGRAMSRSPGLGCPCHLPAPGTPDLYSGLRGHRRGFSCFLSLPCSVHLCPVTGPCTSLPSSSPLIHSCNRWSWGLGAGGRRMSEAGSCPFRSLQSYSSNRDHYSRQT